MEAMRTHSDTVYVRQEDGQLKPVAIPPGIAERAAIYRELRAMGLDLEAIRLVWEGPDHPPL